MRNLEIKNQNGRSMIEMLGVLAIIGVLSVGGIAGYSKAMQKYRINKTIEQITLIAGNVRTFFAPQKSYDGLEVCEGTPGPCITSGKIVMKAKLVPDEIISTGQFSIIQLNNPFGGIYGLKAVPKDSARDNKAFSIKITQVPAEACVELSTHDWQNIGNVRWVVSHNSDSTIYHVYEGMVGCYQNGSGVYESSGILGCPNGSEVSLPLPLDKVANVCSGDDNTIVIGFE